MAEWIYCATGAQVGAAGAAALLREHQAVWCPPPGIGMGWPEPHPRPGDRLWLVWRSLAGVPGPAALLGGGRILPAPRILWQTDVLWAEADRAGLAQTFAELGYSGPAFSRGFLRVELAAPVPEKDFPDAPGLGALSPGLSRPAPRQVGVLRELLAIP